MTWREWWEWFNPKVRLIILVCAVEMVACVVWVGLVHVNLLPKWATYLGGPIVGLYGAWWLYPRLFKS